MVMTQKCPKKAQLVPICSGGPPKQRSHTKEASEAFLIKQMWLHGARVGDFHDSGGLQGPATNNKTTNEASTEALCVALHLRSMFL